MSVLSFPQCRKRIFGIYEMRSASLCFYSENDGLSASKLVVEPVCFLIFCNWRLF